jgi:hypothetical protein
MHNWRKRKTRRYKIVNKDTKEVLDDFMEAGDIEAKARFRRYLKKLQNGTEVLLNAFRRKPPKKRGEWELLLSGGKDTLSTYAQARTVKVEKLCQQDFEYLEGFRKATRVQSPHF